MCGISGVVLFNQSSFSSSLRSTLRLMLNCTCHRGPDKTDLVILKKAALGINRLAIIGLSERSSIYSSPQGQYSIFNGEIVNYKDLYSEYLSKKLINQSDSSIILPLYSLLGEEFVKKLAGMFAIAIYDEKKNKLFLYGDPLGIKPLYYFFDNDKVIFSSEIKAVALAVGKSLRIDFKAIINILRYRFHPGRSTVISKIKRVMPGEMVVFTQGKIKHRYYWQLKNNRKEVKNSFNQRGKLEEFRALFKKIIIENLQSDVSGGFFISGGIDSSLVTAFGLSQNSKYQQPISIRFIPNKTEDEKYGRLLEQFFGKKTEWVEISDDLAMATLERLVGYIDEPLENPIHVGTFLMAQRAKSLGLKTVLTGDGADEFFLGYERHRVWFDKKLKNKIGLYKKWLWTSRPNQLKKLLKPEFKIEKTEIEDIDSVNKALLFERKERLPEYHCMRLDRMTMAFGIEARVPFLDHRLVELSLEIPLRVHFNKTNKEWLKRIAEPFLPKEIIRRPKTHFPSLPDQWLSCKGIDWLKSILLDQGAQIQLWLNQKVIENYIKEHQERTKFYGRLLWAIVSLELWLKQEWVRKTVDY